MKIRSQHALLSLTSLSVVAMVFAVLPAATVSAQSSTKNRSYQRPMSKRPMSKKMSVGLEGYCPVCIVAARKWEKGNPNISSTFDGVTYYFPNSTLKNKFDKSPAEFVPALRGDCIVCYAKHGKRVAGNIRHAALHKERLYLFPSEREKSAFLQDADAYLESDVAENGHCIVCKVAAGKEVAGSTRHTVVHQGLRYLFPSDKEARMFQKNPGKYTAKQQRMEKTAVSNNSLLVSVSGRSACAACEFGVSPLGVADELGLAIVGKDKQVTVVEDAHKLYPEIYKARFQGKQVMAMGKVVKQQGKVTWIQPTSLKLAN